MIIAALKAYSMLQNTGFFITLIMQLHLSYDPNLIMAALFMDLLVARTCGCLILFKIMLFVCAWVLTELLPHPVYAWKQMSPLSILGEKKTFTTVLLKIK